MTQLRLVPLAVPALALIPACGGGDDGPAPGPDGPQGVVPPPPEVAAVEVPDAVRSVILFTVDTLRADRLGCYGSPEGVTPNLDRFASESILFLNPYTQASHTHAAVSAMMTGLFPHHNGVLGMSGILAEGVTPIAVTAQEAGIATGEFSASHCNAQRIPGSAWHEGWDVIYCGKDWDTQQYEWDRKAVGEALKWIEQQEDPFLCWIHLIDPHGEHIPPPEHWDYEAKPVWDGFQQGQIFQGYANRGEIPPDEELDIMNGLYLAEVAGVDDQMGRLMDLLEDLPRRDEIAVIFTADHGEELFETAPRWGHGRVLTEGVLRVPLIVHVPGVEPAVVEDPVETLQVAPTTLQLLDLPVQRKLDGTSLLSSRPSRGYALSFYGSTATIRRGDHRGWITLESLPQDPMYKHYVDIETRSPVPWFSADQVAARFDGAEPNQPLYYAEDELGGSPRDVVLDALAQHLARLRPVKELGTVNLEENQAFLQDLKDMGYLGDE